jgi:hypothetical protein
VRCAGCELRFYAAVLHNASPACPDCDLSVAPGHFTRTPLRDALLASVAATPSLAAQAPSRRPASRPSGPSERATRLPPRE